MVCCGLLDAGGTSERLAYVFIAIRLPHKISCFHIFTCIEHASIIEMCHFVMKCEKLLVLIHIFLQTNKEIKHPLSKNMKYYQKNTLIDEDEDEKQHIPAP